MDERNTPTLVPAGPADPAEVEPTQRDFSGVETGADRYEVRILKGHDLMKIKNLVGGAFDKVQAKIKEARENAPKDEQGRPIGVEDTLGMAIMEVVVEEAFDDAYYWLGDLAGFDRQAWDDEPIDAPISVLESLVENQDLPKLVLRSLRLRQTFMSALRTKPSPAIESQKRS